MGGHPTRSGVNINIPHFDTWQNETGLSSPQVVVFPIPGGPLISAARALMFCQETRMWKIPTCGCENSFRFGWKSSENLWLSWFPRLILVGIPCIPHFQTNPCHEKLFKNFRHFTSRWNLFPGLRHSTTWLKRRLFLFAFQDHLRMSRTHKGKKQVLCTWCV